MSELIRTAVVAAAIVFGAGMVRMYLDSLGPVRKLDQFRFFK
jgi:hypothetical protein